MALPPCGIYRTTAEVAGVPAGRLVYFHNHGDPGPGVYLPEAWEHNRARFSPQGRTLSRPDDAQGLAPLLAEGVYRVERAFTCCARGCRTYAEGTLVQLGYNGAAEAILFVPRWRGGELVFASQGRQIGDDRLRALQPVSIASDAAAEPPSDDDGAFH